MTTVCWDSKSIAADSRVIDGNYHCTKMQKVHRLPSGALLGLAGDADQRAVVELLSRVKNSKALPTRSQLGDLHVEFSAILVFKSGEVWLLDAQWTTYDGYHGEWMGDIVELRDRYYAIGSGAHFALGALAHGASSAQAVAIACKFDPASAPPIHTIHLKEPKPKA